MLQNKNIVIIGGTTGLGLSAAKAFLKLGANLVVVGRNEETVAEAQIILGAKAKALIGDAVCEDTASTAIETCHLLHGGVDGLYHVAGGSGRSMGDGPLHKLSLQGWQKTFELNLTSMMLSNRAVVQYFIKHKKSGAILNMSSVLGFSPSPQFFATHAYAAAKSAAIGFSKSIAAYYAPQNIRVNVVAPALVATPMAQRAANDEAILQFIKTKQPLDGGRIGQPSDLDGLAAYFLSDFSKFVTGQVVAVDGGWSVSEGQNA